MMAPGAGGCRDYTYTAYGLTFRSDFALPFDPAPPAGDADVTIRKGIVPAVLDNATMRFGLWQAAPDAFLLVEDTTCRILVRRGCEIVVQPAADVDSRNFTVFVTGFALTALLQQRGLLPLHSGAIGTDAGAVLFVGKSGAGKSTLVSALAKRGYRGLADDVTAILFDDDDRPVVQPAFGCTRLWADAIDRLGYTNRPKTRVNVGIEKYYLPLPRFSSATAPVRRMYFLATHNASEITIDRLRPGEALLGLARFTHRKKFYRGFGLQREYFDAISRVAAAAPVAQVMRPAGSFLLDELADTIEADLAREPAGSA